MSADEKQQTRRVLRARGVSSYTEQFYSDDESDENELERWTDIEAVYAAPGTQADTSTAHVAPKVRHSNDWSEQEEDSDQDWILPSSRKRKNKRPCEYRISKQDFPVFFIIMDLSKYVIGMKYLSVLISSFSINTCSLLIFIVLNPY